MIVRGPVDTGPGSVCTTMRICVGVVRVVHTDPNSRPSKRLKLALSSPKISEKVKQNVWLSSASPQFHPTFSCTMHHDNLVASLGSVFGQSFDSRSSVVAKELAILIPTSMRESVMLAA